jgi:hypothetical protein
MEKKDESPVTNWDRLDKINAEIIELNKRLKILKKKRSKIPLDGN